VAAANLRAGAAAALPSATTSVLAAASTSVLGKRRKRQNQGDCKQTC
jgi:hypothetical protein